MTGILKDMPNGGKPFAPYFVPDDWSRLQYGRLLWKKERTKNRLLKHSTDSRYPYRDRFLKQREWIEMLLESDAAENEVLDKQLPQHGHSLRTIMRENPPVFGGFY